MDFECMMLGKADPLLSRVTGRVCTNGRCDSYYSRWKIAVQRAVCIYQSRKSNVHLVNYKTHGIADKVSCDETPPAALASITDTIQDTGGPVLPISVVVNPLRIKVAYLAPSPRR